MNILYVGALRAGKTSNQRKLAIEDLGHTMVGINTLPRTPVLDRLWPVRALARMGYAADLTGANRALRRLINEQPFDVLWIDKGLMISPGTLRYVRRRQPACRIVSYSPDDMINPRNQSRQYLRSMSLIDLHVTTKSYNTAELMALGARNVVFVSNGYDPHTHRPLALSEEDHRRWGAVVGFVGGYEEDRFQSLSAVAAAGIPVTVRCYADDWERHRHAAQRNLTIRMDDTVGDNYARTIIATTINLGFLRKANRDLQTSRSIEIPACGGFLLAERTSEHQSLFQEGVEAEFFGSDDELIDKVRYYLIHEDRRLAIARRGYERCMTSRYDNPSRLKRILEFLSDHGTLG